MRLLSRTLPILCMTSLSVSMATAGAPGPGLSGFHAEYQAHYSVFSGTVILDLRPAGRKGEYVYEVHTKARGLARIVRPGTALETSNFALIDGKIRPIRYQLDDGTKKLENDTDIRFDWEACVAHSNYKGEAKDIPIKPGILDRLSADIIVIMGLRAGHAPGSYEITDRNSVRTYVFEALGEELMQVPAGEFRTLKFKRQRPGSTRSTLIWYAPDMDYLPVRIEQQKHGKTAITIVATLLQPDGRN